MIAPQPGWWRHDERNGPMGAVLDQSPDERAQLEADWQAHPDVAHARAAVAAHALDNGLVFDAEGMSAALAFAQRLRLPDSGIHTG